MIIQEAAEMYLETILILKNRQENVRSIDIAKEMGYSKPTISGQMKKFRENGYIEIDSNSYIHLTASGRKIAERIYERHNVIARFLMGIGVDEETAYEDACRMEHYISQITFDHLKSYYDEKLNHKK
jgi:Mn-dependent DtxR family transcriptional regulator